MKNSARRRSAPSALLRLTAGVTNSAIFQTLTSSPTPFADLMLYPEKLEAVLRTLDAWKQRAVSAPEKVARLVRSGMAAVKRAKACRQTDNPLKELRNTEFHLEAPGAKSVQLAADFTDWEKSPLDLIPSEEGVWFAIVPLLPGSYSYRFIVDGQWRDDPQTARSPVHSPAITCGVVKVI